MITTIISITVFIIAIVVHELAHGYVAFRLGDNTAKDAGRLTLNPIAHADMVGTVLLPILLVATKSPVVFGWAKPVPVNPANFKNPRRDMLFTSIAGPVSNFLLALVFAILLRTNLFPPESIVWVFLLYGVLISLVLGVFNLIPIPPLDGSNVLASILPRDLAVKYMSIQPYSFILLIGLLYMGLFKNLIFPVVTFLMKILLG